MNARAVTLPPAMAALRTQGLAKWKAMAPRDRAAAGVGIAVLVVFIVWMLLVAPALRTVREAPAKLDKLEAQLQQMQRLAAEAKTLRGAPEVSVAQAVEPLKMATERLGNGSTINIQGDRATLTVTGVSGDALRDWLGEARTAAHARPVEVTLNRNPQGYAGTVVVTFGPGS
ncbi:type II secretion system protein GspM [Piscinibacter terrae]|uniref:Type II secretion system protein M n=1 Tax=Piscinibacter terrae TaxID=2496871 RepID=A0A3N7K686_9BURK|nr:type II secretion system protein GspM [Albitalea terrae]RQP26415.1 type II secretion system protein M [Albitalea terrae]